MARNVAGRAAIAMNIGTWLFTLWNGKLVGTDEHGNRYYIERRQTEGYRTRRWVIYVGEVEASKVPPRWHAWLHYTTDLLPEESEIPKRPWEKEHLPNLTGTEAAYRPPGHELAGGHRARGTGDYEPWRPS